MDSKGDHSIGRKATRPQCASSIAPVYKTSDGCAQEHPAKTVSHGAAELTEGCRLSFALFAFFLELLIKLHSQ